MTLKLTPAQLDRACGAVLGTAMGDALGAPYEFGSAPLGPEGPRMIGGGLGNFAPGEWTDDTIMAWAILDVAATGADLRRPDALTAIARNFRAWYDSGPADIGNQTRSVLRAAGPEPTGATMTAAAERLHAQSGRTAGNGSLMRTAPVAISYLNDPAAPVDAARSVSALTHADPYAQDACVLWSLAIRHAILYAEFDVRAGLPHLDRDAAAYWIERLDEAGQCDPGRFRPNGWAVTALQARVGGNRPHARAGAVRLPAPVRRTHYGDRNRRRHRHRCGHRPWSARRPVGRFGNPGGVATDLPRVPRPDRRAARRARPPRRIRWATRCLRVADRRSHRLLGPRRTADPGPPSHDDGVWLADASALGALPDDVTAVVSLCLVGPAAGPTRPRAHQLSPHRQDGTRGQPNLEFLLADAARTIADLRDEGHRVLLHCVAAQSRTPTVAIAYAMHRGIEREVAYRSNCAALRIGGRAQGRVRAILDTMTFLRH